MCGGVCPRRTCSRIEANRDNRDCSEQSRRSVQSEMSPAFYFWVVLAVLFVAAELHSAAFFAVFGAAGSVAAAIVALFADEAYALQIGIAIVVAVLGVLLVRPYVSKVFESHGPGDRIG